MIKKALSIMICTLILLMGVPFKSLAADTISQSNIKGVNYSIINVTPMGEQYQQNGNTYVKCNFIHRFQVVLDKEYLGYITGQLNGTYQAYNSTGTYTSYSAQSGSRSYYVAGNTFEYYMETYAYMMINQVDNYSHTYSAIFTYAGSNVVEFGLIATLEDIQRAIETMDFHTEQITQYLYDSTHGTILEQVVTTNQLLVDAGQMFYNVMLATDNINDYVINIYELIEKFVYFNIPFESYPYIYMQYSLNNQFIKFDNVYSYNYPIFQSNMNVNMFNTFTGANVGESFHVIYLLQENTNVSYRSDYTQNQHKRINEYRFSINGSIVWLTLYHDIYIRNQGSSSAYFYMSIPNNVYFTPIYLGKANNVSDSFAQQFDLIDNTYQQELDNNTDQMQNEFDDLFTIEDDYGDQLNNQLNNIDFTNPLQNNSSMLSSGNFVIQVFNGLIANNPLSILIIIVCIFFVARRLFG